MNNYTNLTLENIENEHICCAISDKKHQDGVLGKKEWLKEQIKKGHIFRKLNQNGKVFIEYGDLENEYVPIIGKNYTYIYCFWVSGSFKGKGYGKELLEYAIQDAKKSNKNGICVVTGKKKIPFLSDKQYLEQFGFKTVDEISNNFELLALKFNEEDVPQFTNKSKENRIDEQGLVIYYNNECPYINQCLKEIEEVCKEKGINLKLNRVNSAKEAREIPGFMNNFCIFYNGKFITHELLNKGRLIKFLNL